jgi:hypothetical protein
MTGTCRRPHTALTQLFASHRFFHTSIAKSSPTIVQLRCISAVKTNTDINAELGSLVENQLLTSLKFRIEALI